MTSVLFSLVPESVVWGRALDETGEPLRAARVQLLRSVYVMPNGAVIGGRAFKEFKEGTTNSLGEYRIGDVPANTYWVQATAPPMVASPAGTPHGGLDPGERYVTTFCPNSVDETGALGITVAPGVETRVPDIRIRKAHVVRVHGTVVDYAGRGLSAGSVNLVSEHGLVTASTKVERDGTFGFEGVTPGRFDIDVRRDSGAVLNTTQKIAIGKADVDDLMIRLPQPVDLPGHVNVAKTETGVGFADQTEFSLEGIQIVLATHDERSGFHAEVKSDGKFTINNLIMDSYRMYVKGLPRHAYVKSISIGGQESKENLIFALAGAEVSVILSPDGAQVETIVLDADGKSVTGATVSVVPESFETDKAGNRHYGLNTDQEGKAHFYGIPPGDYKVFVWEDHEPGEPQDPAFRLPFEGNAVKIHLSDRAHVRLQLSPITIKQVREVRAR